MFSQLRDLVYISYSFFIKKKKTKLQNGIKHMAGLAGCCVYGLGAELSLTLFLRE